MHRQQQWVEKYGPWAVITGASDGIGKAAAYELAEAGLNLVLVARRRPVLEALADDLTQRFTIEALVIDADLSRPDDLESVITRTKTLDAGLLVAAAGFGTAGAFLTMPLERELNMLEVNCDAVLAMSHYFAQRFAERGHGGIVLFSSLVAFQGAPLSANYAATKAYIQSLAEGLHRELAPLGVDVLASAPGPIHSGFAARAGMQMAFALTPDVVTRETLKALGRKATVRPGLLSKLLIGSLLYLPRDLRVRIMGQIMKGMTQHQQQAQNATLHPSA